MPSITAAEAEQIIAEEQRQLNAGRMLPPTLARIQRLQAEEVFSICNVGPWDYRLERASLMVYVPAYDATKDHKKLGYAASDPMPDVRREARIINEDEFGYFEDDGRKVARDLIGIGFGLPSRNALTQYGVFVPAGKLPTKEEIENARHLLSECIDRLIAEARDAYDKGPAERAAVITERHLWAARQRGLSEAWVHHQHTQQSQQCEMCGKFNPSGIAKCACGNIVDFDLYKRLQARQKQQLDELDLEEQTKPGKR